MIPGNGLEARKFYRVNTLAPVRTRVSALDEDCSYSGPEPPRALWSRIMVLGQVGVHRPAVWTLLKAPMPTSAGAAVSAAIHIVGSCVGLC